MSNLHHTKHTIQIKDKKLSHKPCANKLEIKHENVFYTRTKQRVHYPWSIPKEPSYRNRTPTKCKAPADIKRTAEYNPPRVLEIWPWPEVDYLAKTREPPPFQVEWLMYKAVDLGGGREEAPAGPPSRLSPHVDSTIGGGGPGPKSTA